MSPQEIENLSNPQDETLINYFMADAEVDAIKREVIKQMDDT
jgi:hypothetical protein